MLMEDIIFELEKYRLGIIKKENSYCLIDKETGEWFANMSIHYIHKLLEDWKRVNTQENISSYFP